MEKFTAKKSLGQNFLTNPKIAERIAQAADIKTGETVLEIGPGTGMLTRALLKEGARVIALEADSRTLPILNASFEKELLDGQLTLIHGDVRTYDIASVLKGFSYKVVANIPYYLSGMLFRLFLENTADQPSTIVFLVQKEVAERIVRSKKESILSLSIKAYGEPSFVATVSRGNFSPQPNVDSAVLKISDISKNSFKSVPESAFFTILKTGFAAKRKHLAGNLSLLMPRADILAAFDALKLPHDVRGEDIHIDTWLALAEKLKSA